MSGMVVPPLFHGSDPMRFARFNISIFVWALLAAGSARGAPASFIPESSGDPAWGACLAQAHEIEIEQHLPQMMLAAVSTVESGRATPNGKAMSPWPWTIFAEGQGQFFRTKAAAIEAVRELRARGVQTIDVGCMQINLRYHPRAFTSLDEAFDPQSNVRYGAHFLQTLKRTHGAWDAALEHYHSYDPLRRETYRARIFAAWLKVQQTDQGFWVASDVPPRLPGETGRDVQLSAAAISTPLFATRESARAWTGVSLLAKAWMGRPLALAAAAAIGNPRAEVKRAVPEVVIAINLSPRPGELFSRQRAATTRADVVMTVAERAPAHDTAGR